MNIWLINLAGLFVILLIIWWFWLAPSSASPQKVHMKKQQEK